MSLVLKYAGVGEENLFFFGGGEKRKGKSSFAVFGYAVGGADCKCAFSCAAGLNYLFLKKDRRFLKWYARFLNTDKRSLIADGSFLKYYVIFLNSDVKILITDKKILS